MAWVQSGEYDRIVAGEYPTRDQQADPRKEAGAAVEFYKLRFQRSSRSRRATTCRTSGRRRQQGRRLHRGLRPRRGRQGALGARWRTRPRPRAPRARSPHAPSADADRRWLARARPDRRVHGRRGRRRPDRRLAGAALRRRAHAHRRGRDRARAVAARLAARPPRRRVHVRLGRAEILSAQVNGAALLVLAGVIGWRRIRRLVDPPDVDGRVVLVVGLAGAA